MTYQEKLRQLSDTLGKLPVSVYHFWRPKMEAPFAVWQEEGENSFSADNSSAEQEATGTVDYFTHEEFDSMLDRIPESLRKVGISCVLLSVQYEENTKLIHYEWEWSV